MASSSHTEICKILDDKGPDLLERIELSERFYQCLTSEEVIQDRTLIRDLKVGEYIILLLSTIIISFKALSQSLLTMFRQSFAM